MLPQDSNGKRNKQNGSQEPSVRGGAATPSPVVTPPDAPNEGENACCKENEQRATALLAERENLQRALQQSREELASKDEELASRIAELDHSYKSSLDEMRSLLSSQRKVGDRWKGEMEILTKRFEAKVKELSGENKELRCDLERKERRLKEKEMEADEARELCGIYSAKLTKMQRKFKKLKDEDEESYIEMTF